jgi:arylsulfatase A
MSIQKSILFLGLALVFGHPNFASDAGPRPGPAAPPNIVFILADDLGWSDIACYGGDLHRTPNLDALAREGVRFTQAYAMSVCSPTRAAILTGKHAARLHITTWRESSLGRQAEAERTDRLLLPPVTAHDLPCEETTIAELLKARGYLTFHVGKWHVGDAAHSPETQGFDVNIGGTHWGAPSTYFHPFRGPSGPSREFRYVPGLGLGKPGQFLTDRLTDEAIKLIDAAGTRPFFLNLWFHNPHTPIEGKPEIVEQYRRKLHPGLHHQNPEYAAMIETLDENIGRILRHLNRRGLAKHTAVFFASDNGGYTNVFRGRRVTDNTPLRSGKGSLYEGGIRVPFIARVPNVTPKGVVCNEPVICMDIFSTIAELAGATVTEPVDGKSLVGLLRDPKSGLARDALYFHFPHYYPTTTPVSAVRRGDWKLLEYHEDGRLELYNLRDDIAEQHDLADRQPTLVSDLKEQLGRWRLEVGAQAPIRRPGSAR